MKICKTCSFGSSNRDNYLRFVYVVMISSKEVGLRSPQIVRDVNWDIGCASNPLTFVIRWLRRSSFSKVVQFLKKIKWIYWECVNFRSMQIKKRDVKWMGECEVLTERYIQDSVELQKSRAWAISVDDIVEQERECHHHEVNEFLANRHVPSPHLWSEESCFCSRNLKRFQTVKKIQKLWIIMWINNL